MMGKTAVVYSEAFFGTPDGKTANGLVRHSEKYRILSVIDSTKVGTDAGEYLDGVPNGIPICADLADAIAVAGRVPDYFIIGVAPLSGLLSAHQRGVVIDAMRRGMYIVNGLHEFLNDDLEFTACAAQYGVRMLDVRRPRAKKDLRMFTGAIDEVSCPRIAVLGTDGAIGKRTTAVDPHARAQRARHQGGHGRHRPDRAHPGRALRRGAGRRSRASSARARWRPRSWRPSRPSTRTSSSSRGRAR